MLVNTREITFMLSKFIDYRICLVGLSLFISNEFFGNDTIPNKIYKEGFHWRKNGIKLSDRELRNELYKVPLAIPFYKKAKRERIIGFSLTGAAGILGLLSSKRNNDGFNPKKNIGLKIATIVTASGGIISLCRSIKNMKKAVMAYNTTY